MDVTGRWWATAGSGLVLVAVGVLAARPLLLVAATAVGAWLLGVAAVSSRAFTRVHDQMTVIYTLSAADVFVETPVAAELRIERPLATASIPMTARVDLPPGVDAAAGDRTVTLAAGDTEATTTFTVTSPVAGRFVFPPPTLSFADPMALYRTKISGDATPSVTVRPRTPELHVGQGGEGVRGVYGQHQADRPGPGVTIRELRRYVPGDDVRQIDWPATARLAETYVRETEGETDRRTVLLVDHRDRMAIGRDGETMLEYAREVGIGIARTAADYTDPLGFRAVGDTGVTELVKSSTSARTYTQVERLLYGLMPTDSDPTTGGRPAVRARELADRLADDESAFAGVLGAYVADPDPYVLRLRDDPLVGTVRRIRNQVGTDGVLVVVTSDDDSTTLREAVTTAIRGGGRAVIFLTPRCLFEPTGLTDLDAAYEQYREFERLRRDLNDHPRVTALEIAPESRLDAVLAHHKATHRSAR